MGHERKISQYKNTTQKNSNETLPTCVVYLKIRNIVTRISLSNKLITGNLYV